MIGFLAFVLAASAPPPPVPYAPGHRGVRDEISRIEALVNAINTVIRQRAQRSTSQSHSTVRPSLRVAKKFARAFIQPRHAPAFFLQLVTKGRSNSGIGRSRFM